MQRLLDWKLGDMSCAPGSVFTYQSDLGQVPSLLWISASSSVKQGYWIKKAFLKVPFNVKFTDLRYFLRGLLAPKSQDSSL